MELQENNLLVLARHNHGLTTCHVQKASHVQKGDRLKPHRPETPSVGRIESPCTSGYPYIFLGLPEN